MQRERIWNQGRRMSELSKCTHHTRPTTNCYMESRGMNPKPLTLNAKLPSLPPPPADSRRPAGTGCDQWLPPLQDSGDWPPCGSSRALCERRATPGWQRPARRTCPPPPSMQVNPTAHNHSAHTFNARVASEVSGGWL